FSNRFGSIKLCAKLADGRTVFQHTLANLASAIPDIIVVTRSELGPLLSEDSPRMLIFPDAEQGMGASLAFGVAHIGDWDACLVCLADMPAILPASYAAIQDKLTADTIVVPRYHGKPGNPCGFGRNYFAALQSLRGDRGGRSVINSNPGAVVYLDIEDPGLLCDIDTPEDIQKLAGRTP
ncbi:MAG: nucleotidyltransferase family protein, partial [Pseudohongiellaceae bacterium]